ncbi:MAG TPA: diadenylate cyclase CdaA, partial [Myxococcota bacterium]|nr:diadenylate cyclase CdaA [Myxococcota bacterium]
SELTRVDPVQVTTVDQPALLGMHGAQGTMQHHGIAAYRVSGALFFGAVGKIEMLLDQDRDNVSVVILEMHQLIKIDTTGLDAIETLLRVLRESPFATATWVDWLDVGVLTLSIFGVLHMLRGTRAFQILLGMLLLAAMYLVSAWLGLAALHWVLDNLFVYAVLAVIILFQEDIRQVLAVAGGTVFASSGRAQVEEAQRLEEIVRAAFALAQRRIGALVVLERTATLGPYVESAHELEAVVTSELLQAIFHPTSPIHDGAVTIERGRVGHAGVFLPLSLVKNLPKAYGTRHRAALGLTERTDAVCLLVSEERGTVALVMEGRVVPVVDANDLRQKLQEVIGAPVGAAEVPAA